MKGMAKWWVALMAVVLLSGVTGQAMARERVQYHQLLVGNTPSQYVGGIHSYQFQVNTPTKVSISSDQ